MNEYLKNLLRRIQRLSRDLNTIEAFVDKAWIYKDQLGNNHQYTFLRDKRFLMAINGVNRTGSWELLPTNQLLINRLTDEILLEKFFIHNAIIVMKLSGSDDEPFMLIDPQMIPDLNGIRFLENYEREDEDRRLPPSERRYTLLDDNTIDGPEFYEGKRINFHGTLILSGNFRTTDKRYKMFVELDNNTITSVYYMIDYSWNSRLIEIKQRHASDINHKDRICNTNGIPFGEYIEIVPTEIQDYNKSVRVKVNNEGYITHRYYPLERIMMGIFFSFFFVIIIFILLNKAS